MQEWTMSAIIIMLVALTILPVKISDEKKVLDEAWGCISIIPINDPLLRVHEGINISCRTWLSIVVK